VPKVHGGETIDIGSDFDKIDNLKEHQFDPQSTLIEVDLRSMQDLIVAYRSLFPPKERLMNLKETLKGTLKVLGTMIEDCRRLCRRSHVLSSNLGLIINLRNTRNPDVQIGQTRSSKIKRGSSGFTNTTQVSAIADTGSAQNVISAAYASYLKLPIERASSSFQLGNSKAVQSIGRLTAEFV